MIASNIIQNLFWDDTEGRYYHNTGMPRKFMRTPDATANRITGDIDVAVKLQYKINGGQQFLIGKWGPNNTAVSWGFLIQNSNQPAFFYTNNGSTLLSAISDGTALTDGELCYLRVTRIQTTGVLAFWKSTDGITWTSLRSFNTGNTIPLYDTTSDLSIGSRQNSTSICVSKIYHADIYSGLRTESGTKVVEFSASDFVGGNAMQLTSSTTGEIWTGV